MHTSPNTSDLQDTRQADRLWAALMFFTRLPLWRIRQVDAACFRHVVDYWPLAGWLTGGLIALMFWVLSTVVPPLTAALLAVGTRLLLTGALHEDGLADCCDGFGGGTDRGRILSIMKDSRIGTYGVIGLGLYLLLLFSLLASMPAKLATLTVMAADPFSKMVSAQIILMLPYARREDEAKARVVYRKISLKAGIGLFIQGMLPFVMLIYVTGGAMRWDLLLFAPCLVMYFMYLLIWHRLKGYTGDCCGAMFLLTELSFYLCATYQTFNNKALWTWF